MYNHLDKSPETYTEWKQLVSNGFILYHSVYMTFLKWQKFQEFERISRIWASLVAQRVKHLPAMRETWVWSLGWEDPWRRKWQPTPVFLPGESHGWRSMVGYSPWGRKELDTTERASHSTPLVTNSDADKDQASHSDKQSGPAGTG